MIQSEHDVILNAFSSATLGRNDLSCDEERLLLLLIEDRQQLGTLAADPVTIRDIAMVKMWVLIGKLTRGDDLAPQERQIVGRLVSSLMPQAMRDVSEKFRRLDAARRGGEAGRTANPREIVETWDGFFASSGKRTWADTQTAKKKSISARTVRRIRSEFGRK